MQIYRTVECLTFANASCPAQAPRYRCACEGRWIGVVSLCDAHCFRDLSTGHAHGACALPNRPWQALMQAVAGPAPSHLSRAPDVCTRPALLKGIACKTYLTAVWCAGAFGLERHPFFPCPCPMIYQPVCGNDGVTYPNDCDLACAARVLYKGLFKVRFSLPRKLETA